MIFIIPYTLLILNELLLFPYPGLASFFAHPLIASFYQNKVFLIAVWTLKPCPLKFEDREPLVSHLLKN